MPLEIKGRPTALLLVAGLIWMPFLLSAQVVHGHVVDFTSGMSVARGFVILLDPLGNEVVRSLSSSEGRFTLQAPAAGLYRLRSERIGFRASESEFFDLGEGETIEFTLRVAALPVRLEALVVSGSGRCNANPAEGANTVLIWEEVRKALAATVWGEEKQLFHYRQYTYRRVLNERRNRKLGETFTIKSGIAEPPFRSVPAEQLAQDGYIAERDDGTWYYLPDAQTLLDSDFLSTHCFRVVRAERERPGQVGLAFEPMSDRTLPDVEGALWLDEESSELRELEVRHTGVSYDLRDDRVGGNVQFMILPSGAWIVREWQVRTPKIDVTVHPRYTRGQRAEVAGFTDTGGEVFEVANRDGTTVYEAPMATVLGSVYDSTSAAPLKGALVSVVGTDFRSLTDSAGRFELDVPLHGEYLLELDHPHLDSVAALDQLISVELQRGASTRAVFAIPHLGSALHRICEGSDLSTESRVIFGVVREYESGEAVGGAPVSAFWQVFRMWRVAGVGPRAGEITQNSGLSVSVRDMSEHVTSDENGFYAICDVPAGRPVRLYAASGGTASREASITFSETGRDVVQFAWDRAPGTPWEQGYYAPHPAWKLDLVLGDPRPVALSAQSPVLYGTVTDSASGMPISGVTVVLNKSSRTVTDADGNYRLADVVWHSSGNLIEFSRLGYAQRTVEMQLESQEREVLLNISLPPLPIEMAEVVVEGERISVPARLKGGYERRESERRQRRVPD